MSNPQFSLLLTLALSATSPLLAQSLPPGDLMPGESYRILFVTTDRHDALATDIAVYNSFVQAQAAADPELAPLGVNWTAVCSTATVNARDNTNMVPASSGTAGVPIYRPDGTRLADHYNQLWNARATPLFATPSGATSGRPFEGCWTGTSNIGTTNLPLGDLTRRPHIANNWLTDHRWISGYTAYSADVPLRFYGVSDVLTVPTPPTYQVPLNFNFNGIVHPGEARSPDDPDGFRSISDRALDFTAGIPTDPMLDRYSLASTAGTLDLVHLGNRNRVDGGNWAFDPFPDSDNIGIQPNWLPNVDQSGPQVTTLASPLSIGMATASLIYQISNGGGSFDVTFRFADSTSLTETVSATDWFQGPLAGTDSTDFAGIGPNLSVTEATIDLSTARGRSIVAIEFSNSTNINSGIAIFGMRIDQCVGSITSFGTGCATSAGTVARTSVTGDPCIGSTLTVRCENQGPIDYFLAIGFNPITPIDLSAIGGPAGCSLLINIATTWPQIAASPGLSLPIPLDPFLSGRSIYFQSIVTDDPSFAPIPVPTSDGVQVQF